MASSRFKKISDKGLGYEVTFRDCETGEELVMIRDGWLKVDGEFGGYRVYLDNRCLGYVRSLDAGKALANG